MNMKFSHWRLIAAIYALILFLLNFIRIFDNNFWADEAYTATLVVNSVADIIKITAADMHPPLYYLFVKAGYSLFGNQGWMFHFVSLIPCAIIMIFALTEIWKKMGKETAFILITFIGLSSNAVTYNVEVRMYSWGSLFILLTFYALYLILTEDKGRNYILFKYYYPGAFSRYVELGKIPKLRKDKNYWLIVAGEQKKDAAFEQLRKQGFSWTVIVNDGNLGTNRVWIYKLDYNKR